MKPLANRHLVGIVLALPLSTAPTSAAGGDHLLTQRFGDRLEQVRQTAAASDDVALARELLRTAQAESDRDGVPAALCYEAFVLSWKSVEGTDVAAEAMQWLAEHDADQKQAALQKLAELRDRQFDAARGDARIDAGDALIRARLDLAEVRKQAGKYAEAIADYRRAMLVATAVRSPIKPQVQEQMREAVAAQRNVDQVRSLKQRLERTPDNAYVLRELLQVAVVQLNQPELVADYIDRAPDPSWRNNLPLVLKDVNELSTAQQRVVGLWYASLAEDSAASHRSALLKRAYGYLGRAVQHGDDSELAAAYDTVQSQLLAMGVTPPAIKQPRRALPSLPNRAMTEPVGNGALFEALRAPQEMRAKSTGWIDVLDSMVPRRDGIIGIWGAEGGAVQGESLGAPAQAVMPIRIEGTYRLFLAFTARQGSGTLRVVTPVGASAAELFIPMSDPGAGGMNTGEEAAPVGLIQKPEFPILPGDACTLQIQIAQQDGKLQLTAWLNDEPYIRWEGAAHELSLPEMWRSHKLDAVALSVESSGQEKLLIDFMEMKVKPIDGGRVGVFQQ